MAETTPDMSAVLEALDRLRRRCDQAFARVAARHPREVACRLGCDDCCHALFDLAPVEALALCRAFAALPRRRRREARRRAEKAARLYDQVLAQAQAASGARRLEVLSRARVPCPLLAEGRCLLYAERPVTCRLYGVPVEVEGRARTCHRARFRPGVSYPTVKLAQVQAELEELSRQACRLVPELPRLRLDVARAIQLEGVG